MNVALIIGTRPEIIKTFPLMRVMDKKDISYFILHSGQHYSYSLDRSFFELLNIKPPKYNLEVGSGSHAEQTGKILVGVEKVLTAETPDVVLVQGDTNTVLGGALAARKLNMKVGHVEAGLRSRDRKMPEEVNRILTDHASDYLFAPTEMSKQALLCEGIDESTVLVSGNTIVDAVNESLNTLEAKPISLENYQLKRNGYFLVTLHRQENVDDNERLNNILKGLIGLRRTLGLPIVFPIHPRTRKRLKEFSLDTGELTLLEPADYFNFLLLESNAQVILTDSGGVQEEACILHVPCVTLRDNTERPETIDVGANVLSGSGTDAIMQCTLTMVKAQRNWKNPFGDGHAGEKIINWIMERA